MNADPGDFYEEDEDPAKIRAAFDASARGRDYAPTCSVWRGGQQLHDHFATRPFTFTTVPR